MYHYLCVSPNKKKQLKDDEFSLRTLRFVFVPSFIALKGWFSPATLWTWRSVGCLEGWVIRWLNISIVDGSEIRLTT